MNIGHCTELLLATISFLEEDAQFDNWIFEHSFRIADTWIFHNPESSIQNVKIKIHGSGLNIDVYTSEEPHYQSFWLSTKEHLPQLEAFLHEHLNLPVVA